MKIDVYSLKGLHKYTHQKLEIIQEQLKNVLNERFETREVFKINIEKNNKVFHYP